MGSNSNRSRTRCKTAQCVNKGAPSGLTRSNSGLCRACMQTPAEAVIIRTERPLRDDYNRWPLRWEGGAVYRDRLAQTATLPAEAPREVCWNCKGAGERFAVDGCPCCEETAAPTCDRTDADNASHSASGCGHAGIVVATDDAPVSVHPGRFTASEIATLIGIAAIGVALFLASPLGAGVIEWVRK